MWKARGTRVPVPREQSFQVSPFSFPGHRLFLMEVYPGPNSDSPNLIHPPSNPKLSLGTSPSKPTSHYLYPERLEPLEDTLLQPAGGIKTLYPSAPAISQLRIYSTLSKETGELSDLGQD